MIRLQAVLLVLLTLGMTCFAQSGLKSFERIGIIKDYSVSVKKVQEDFVVDVEARGIGGLASEIAGAHLFMVNGDSVQLNFVNGKAQCKTKEAAHLYLQHKSRTGQIGQFSRAKVDGSSVTLTSIPLWTSLLPPLIAIIMALLLKEVFISLFIGIWAGAFILNGFTLSGLVSSFLQVLEKYVLGALTDSSHLSVIVFSLMIGGMVAIVSRNGGMAGIVNQLATYANSARNSQLITWFLGLAIFFDDYANTLIVGNTVRPVTDKYRVSREKLAYIVDSTAAPVAAIAFVTTWIGAELDYIDGACKNLGIQESAYSMFLNSLSYSFYPVLTLLFILMIILTQKDYGPMFKAERRARTTGQLSASDAEIADSEELEEAMDELAPVPGAPLKWYNGLVPVLAVIIVTIIGLLYTGHDAEVWSSDKLGFFGKLSEVIGKSDSYIALLWSSLTGVAVAVLMTLAGRIMTITGCMNAMVEGFKTMLPAIVILTLAWSLAQITEDMHTADYLTSLVAGNISAYWMPLLTFLMAGAIAFATGSSWGTMAILYPLILPTTWSLCISNDMEMAACMPIFYNVISCVLAGAVFGDHCSPISDTTILSSLATNCNHIDHVRTQFPYAMTVGIVSIFLGTFSVMVGLPAIVNYAIGAVVLFAVVNFLGKKNPEAGVG